MKNRLYSISIYAVFLIPFVGPWEGASSLKAGYTTEGTAFKQAAYQSAASFMPILDTDMSDLDVRDTQNRPVREAGSSQGLTELFMNSLFNLTVVGNLHGISQIWEDISLFSRLFHDLIFNIFYPLREAIPKALQPSTKRFVHNVHNLWISLSVGLFLCISGFMNFLAKPSHQKLILRC
jgi:hypothetical protein